LQITKLTVLHFFPQLSIFRNKQQKRNKLPSTQLVSVISLIWQHVSTSEGHLQASNTKYIKGILYNFIKFLNSDLSFKIALSNQLYTRKG
jgi:hypothetical protein